MAKIANELRPVYLPDLIRVGNKNDGGYVINKRVIGITKCLLGLGISTEWSFEEEFQKLNPKAIVHGYDFSVSEKIIMEMAKKHPFISAKKIIKNSFKKLLHVLFFFVKDKNKLGQFEDVNYFHVKKIAKSFGSFFSRENNKFYQLGISNLVDGHFVNFKTVMDNLPKPILSNSVFVKMDIEGSEFGVLPDVLPYSDSINCLAIEFHGVNAVDVPFLETVQMLKKNFYISHIHANNYELPSEKTGLPTTLEMVFLKKELVHNTELGAALPKYPLEGLDAACNPDMPDQFLAFE